jgi:hypothetical protein
MVADTMQELCPFKMGKTCKIDDFWMTSLVLILLYLNDIWKRSVDPLSLILHLKIIIQLFFHLHMCSFFVICLFLKKE